MNISASHRSNDFVHLDVPPGDANILPMKAVHGLRILVVEDDEDALRLTQELLTHMGHWSAGVGSAEAAVARFSEGAFDLLLLDVNLPALSGLDLAEKLCRLEPLPVIFASGAGRPRDGAAGSIWLDKPYTTGQLEDALSRTKGTLRRADA